MPDFDVVPSAKSGEYVNAFQGRFNKVAEQHPHLLFLFFWNSDMSLSPVSLVKNPLYQASYKQQAINLILSIKGVSDVIVSGPTVFWRGHCFDRKDTKVVVYYFYSF